MKITKKLAWILMFLCMINLVIATGIRPAKTSIAFDEGRDYSKEFWIINNDARTFSVDIFVEGEMAKFVTIDKKTVTFRGDEDAEVVNFEVHLPEEVPPGISTANIIIREKLRGNDPGTISSIIILKHKIVIQGSYPDKYIKIKINFQENSKTIKFVSEVENLGKKDIEKLKTIFYVNDKEQKQQALETESTGLPTKETVLLTAEIESESFIQGEYTVSAVTSYDDQIIETYKNLIIGKPEVEITYFNKYFIANKINPYSLDLLNKWNRKIKNVFVNVEIKKDDIKVDEFRTKSVDIEGEMIERINDYLDAKDKDPGEYTFEMVVNFWNLVRMDQKKFEIDSEFISEQEANSLGNSLVGNAVAGISGSSNGTLLWVLVGILGLLIGGIITYVGYRFIHRNEYE